MVLTVIPMALNVVIGVTLWLSDISLLPQIIITVILAAKYFFYLYTALLAGSGRVKSIGLLVCVAGNIVLIGYFVFAAVWNAIPGCAVLTILAIVWGSISGFTFKKED